jgi:hypothetical protein
MSVNLGGGRDETAREHANDSPSTNEDGHEEGSRKRHINKGLQKRMFEDEEEDQGTDDDSGIRLEDSKRIRHNLSRRR